MKEFLTPEMHVAINTALIAALGLMAEWSRRKINTIKAEVTTNHGSSTKDAVNRTEQIVSSVSDDMTALTILLNNVTKDIGGIREEIRELRQTDNDIRSASSADYQRMFDIFERNHRNGRD